MKNWIGLRFGKLTVGIKKTLKESDYVCLIGAN